MWLKKCKCSTQSTLCPVCTECMNFLWTWNLHQGLMILLDVPCASAQNMSFSPTGSLRHSDSRNFRTDKWNVLCFLWYLDFIKQERTELSLQNICSNDLAICLKRRVCIHVHVHTCWWALKGRLWMVITFLSVGTLLNLRCTLQWCIYYTAFLKHILKDCA